MNQAVMRLDEHMTVSDLGGDPLFCHLQATSAVGRLNDPLGRVPCRPESGLLPEASVSFKHSTGQR